MYDLSIDLDNFTFSTSYQNLTLEQVREKLAAQVLTRGYSMDTPIQGWKEKKIEDGIKILEFSFERYQLSNDNFQYGKAEIRNASLWM